MSNSLAIAAVTAALYDILSHVKDQVPGADAELSDTEVTTKALDVARGQENHNQVNIFLFQTQLSAAWRNQDIPGQGRPGETATSPLALNLFYLLTAYGRQGDDLLTHRVLGRAMNLLHDQALLSPDLLARTLANHALVKGHDLNLQAERVRITQQPLTLEELSKLWGLFQAKYRISVAYQVSVVLIESTRPLKAPLPVLRRGAQDRGPLVGPSLASAFPGLSGYKLADNRPVAYLGVQAATAPVEAGLTTDLAGDWVVLSGQSLNGSELVVHLSHPLLTAPVDITAFSEADAVHVKFILPSDLQNLPAGMYTVSVERIDPDPEAVGSQRRATNVLALPIGPRLLRVSPSPWSAAAASKLLVVCSPPVLPAQRVSLLVGSQEIFADPRLAATAQPCFDLQSAGLPPGTYPLRLRVDGVESPLIDYAATPPSYIANQPMVELTP